MAGNRSLFFVVMACVMLMINFIGFREGYFVPLLSNNSTVSMVMHVHVALGFGLFALFVVQSFLVYRNRMATHRKTGPIAALIAILLVVAGAGMILEVAEGYSANPAEDQVVPMLIKASSVWVSLFVETCFAVFIGLAILLRSKSAYHKRLIYLAFVGISSPALAQIGLFPVLGLSPAVFTVSSMLLLVICLALYDLAIRRRVHLVTVVGGTVQIVGLGLCAAVIPYTEFGQSVILKLS